MSEKTVPELDENQRVGMLEHARALVMHLEEGDDEKVYRVVNEISSISESGLYREVAMLTRELHEKMNSFIDDARIRAIMHEEIPDARDRLNYVIKLTEESAHRTLTAVEHGMPVVDKMGLRAGSLREKWLEFMHKKQGVDKLRVLIEELDEYLQQIVVETRGIHNDMFDVLLAQGYQDITGQIIQRVIDLVQSVEQSLVTIIRTSSQHVDDGAATVQDKRNMSAKGNSDHGPVIPGVTGGDVMKSQDDVDDFLSSLGF